MSDFAVLALLAALSVASAYLFAAMVLYHSRKLFEDRQEQADRIAGGYTAVAEGAARAVGEAVAAATGPVADAQPPATTEPLPELDDDTAAVLDDIDWSQDWLPDRVGGRATVGLRMPDGTVVPEMAGEEYVADDGWDGPT